MTTKERVADEALTLFSTKGYKGTSVKSIADAVGIKDSSLYKHFKSKAELLFYLKDHFASRFLKMAMMEQYHSSEIYEVYHRILMEESIAYQTGLVREMIRQGRFRAVDPEVMAINFYSPIFFLLNKYMG